MTTTLRLMVTPSGEKPRTPSLAPDAPHMNS